MVGKIVGAVSFLSVIALVWLLLWRAGWNLAAMGGALVLFLVIGGFATINPGEWQKKGKA